MILPSFQIVRLHLKRSSQPLHGGGVHALALAGLDGGDRGPAHIADLCELYLGEAAALAMFI
jgi:hypothetical protein